MLLTTPSRDRLRPTSGTSCTSIPIGCTRALAFGPAHVFYPEARDARCTAALLLDIEPVGLVRGHREGASLEPSIHDRPYVASSFMSAAIAEHFGTAMNGRSKERQELADLPLPLEAALSAVPVRGGEAVLRRLSEPLGYTVEAEAHALSETFTDSGDAAVFRVTIRGEVRLRELLSHLDVLIPVLDDQEHCWVSEAEIEKLRRRGEGWLAAHPECELITSRYLARQANLTREALGQLTVDGALLAWGAVTPLGRAAAVAGRGFVDALGLEQQPADLAVWREPAWYAHVEMLADHASRVFEALR